MAEPKEPFEYTGGFGCGPAGSMPAGSAFQDENTVDPRPDILALPLEYENEALVILTDE